MNIPAVEIIIAIQGMQCIAAVILAALLLYFFRTFRNAFLHHWALSALALGLYLGASAGALLAYSGGQDFRQWRYALSAVSLGAAYPHVVWLMIGTWEALRQRTVDRRREWWLVGIAVLLGVASASVAPFDPDAARLRNLMRVELRYALTGAAFLVAAVLLWRAQRPAGHVGARLTAIGFCLFGLQMLHVVGINLRIRAGGQAPFYTPYVGLVDFLFQALIGLGIVVWLLELQRERAARAHSDLEHARRHDATTGLPNRRLLVEQIGEMIGRTGARHIAVISVGINRFAVLNRALGWRRTEELVARIAERLHESIGQRCALGRLSDRDFLIVRPTLDDPDAIRDWTERVLGLAIGPVRVQGQEIVVTLCAGISLYPDDARTAETLIQHSQHALVQSAQIGRDVTLFQHLDPGQHDEVAAGLKFESELRHGLDAGEFEMHYQPIFDIADRRAVGAEALIRWRHPARGLLPPDRFLDEAASIGVLDALEEYALEAALAQLAQWRRDGHLALGIAVNASARRFQMPDLVERVVAACDKHGVPADRVGLEITENTALRDIDSAAAQIVKLNEAGIGVALDDFGSGYSSLASLLRLPVDRIKLDRLFLESVDEDPRQRELLAAIIGLGQRLELEVVAEGVETRSQFDFLAGQGCDLAQGYWLHRPVPPDQCRFEASVVA